MRGNRSVSMTMREASLVLSDFEANTASWSEMIGWRRCHRLWDAVDDRYGRFDEDLLAECIRIAPRGPR